MSLLSSVSIIELDKGFPLNSLLQKRALKYHQSVTCPSAGSLQQLKHERLLQHHSEVLGTSTILVALALQWQKWPSGSNWSVVNLAKHTTKLIKYVYINDWSRAKIKGNGLYLLWKTMAPGAFVFAVKLVPAFSPRYALSMNKELVTERPCIHATSRLLWIAPLCTTSALVPAGVKMFWATSDLLGGILQDTTTDTGEFTPSRTPPGR